MRTITKDVRLGYPPSTVWAFLLTESAWANWWYDDTPLVDVNPGWEVGATMVFGSEWAPTIGVLSPPTTLAFAGHRFDLDADEAGGTHLLWTNSRRSMAEGEYDPVFFMEEEVNRQLGDAMDIALERFVVGLAAAATAQVENAITQPHDAPTQLPGAAAPSFAELAPDPTPREIRVFVSSTFKDLQAERDELSKRTFIELRRFCEERGVAWTDIDLRWGITDEQKAEGKVLPICLEEIDNCRPYFIGILGERYGWVPEELPKDQVDRIPWLAEGRGRSVTEMEIVHGVLNEPEMAPHAFFYFRDPHYIERLPPHERPDHREGPTPEEIRRLGRWTAEERAEERRRRLADLKARIEKSGLTVRRFGNPQELASLVADDLKQVVDARFPAESSPNRREAAAFFHEGVIREARRTFVPRSTLTRRLDAHVDAHGPPLVLAGEAGSGKSALLADWIHQLRERFPENPVIPHFVGASAESASWDDMLARLLDELALVAEQEFEVPDDRESLRKAFIRALHAAAARRRFVLVIDGLNELEDKDQALELVWLPPDVPESVRVVLSTLPGRPVDEAMRRGWPVVEVGRLEPDERVDLIREHLARYRKSLSDQHMKRILANDLGGNPLYLCTVLDELRLHGDHATLGDVIGHYTEGSDLPGLFQKVLLRLENDYEGDRPGLVGEALTLLLAARRGLSEDEILDLLGSGGHRLPRALWSPLHLAVGHLVSSRSGHLGLRHEQMREAVAARYLGADEDRAAVHHRVADYFEARPWGPRRTEELPWQLARAGAWNELAHLLGDLDFLDEAWRANRFDVRRYWTQIEQESPRRVADQYRNVIDSPEPGIGTWSLAGLLGSMGHAKEAATIQEAITREALGEGDKANVMASLGNQAQYLRKQGRWQDAQGLFRQQEKLALELGHHVGVATALGGQAGIQRVTGNLDAAWALYEKEAELRRIAGDRIGLQFCLGNQALVQMERGDLAGALELRMEQERLAREAGAIDGMMMALEGQSVICRMTGSLALAMEKSREAESLCRGLGDRNGLATTLINQGTLLLESGDADDALDLYREAELICRDIGEQQDLATAINNQGAIYFQRGQLHEASRCYQECEEICRALGYAKGVEAARQNRARVAVLLGDAPEM